MAQRGPPAPRGHRIYIKGIGAVVSNNGTDFVFRSAPRPRSKTQSQAQIYATATMAVANRLLSTMTAWEKQQATEIAGRGGYTWKDVMIANMFGTASEFTTEDGVFYDGRRLLAADIQTLLDSISSTQGSILVRTANGWAALYSGADGETLTINPTTHMPDWITADIGIGGGAGAWGNTNFDTAGNTNLGGPLLVATTGIVPKGFNAKSLQFACHDTAPVCTVTPFIYEVTSPSTAVILVRGPTLTSLHYGINDCPFDVPYNFAVSKVAAFGICITTGSFNMMNTGPTRNLFKGGVALPTDTLSGWSTSQASANAIWLAGSTSSRGVDGAAAPIIPGRDGEDADVGVFNYNYLYPPAAQITTPTIPGRDGEDGSEPVIIDNGVYPTKAMVTQQTIQVIERSEVEEGAPGSPGKNATTYDLVVGLASSQSIAPGASDKLTLNSVVINDGGYYDATTNYRWTPRAGSVTLIARALAIVCDNANPFTLRILKNGTNPLTDTIAQCPSTPLAGFQAAQLATIDKANGTDSYSVYILNNSGTVTLSIANFMANTSLNAVDISP